MLRDETWVRQDLRTTGTVHDETSTEDKEHLSNRQRQCKVLLDQEYRHAPRPTFENSRTYSRYHHWRQAFRRLVQQDEIGAAGQCPGNGQHLLLSSAQASTTLLRPRLQIGENR